MNDERLNQVLKEAYKAAEPEVVPPFDEAFANATRRMQQRRMRRQLGTAAAAMVAVVTGVLLWQAQHPGLNPMPVDDLLIADALMNATTWQAPSDVLMPDHQFDIYQDMPFEDVSTNLQEGPLL